MFLTQRNDKCLNYYVLIKFLKNERKISVSYSYYFFMKENNREELAIHSSVCSKALLIIPCIFSIDFSL